MQLASHHYMEEQFFLYFPTETEIMYKDQKLTTRRIFEGQITFNSMEEQLLQELRVYADVKKVAIDPWWTQPALLRVLYANKFKIDKTIESMTQYIEWRRTMLPPKASPSVIEYLQQGTVYVNGRDNRFRPIVVISAVQLEARQKELELALDSLTYLFEFILKEYMLPGQIENWVVILDMGKLGIGALPKNTLQKLLGYLQNNYRSRMYVCYIVNCPKSITFAWNMIKGSLAESTVAKIKFFNENIPDPLFTHCHKEQVEITYGGLQPIIPEGQFWPPKVNCRKYFLETDIPSEILITKEKYAELLKSGYLKLNIVPDTLQPKPMQMLTPPKPKQQRDHQSHSTDLAEEEFEGPIPPMQTTSRTLLELTKSRLDIHSNQTQTVSSYRPTIVSQIHVVKKTPHFYGIEQCFHRQINKKAILF